MFEIISSVYNACGIVSQKYYCVQLLLERHGKNRSLFFKCEYNKIAHL